METYKSETQFAESVGIDVSKLTLDVFIYNKKQHQQFTNTKKGFAAMQKWIKAEVKSSDIIYCFEHTGWYCVLLSHFLAENSICY